MPTKAIVVLSGGQDSTTCLFWATNKFDVVKAVTFDYGQKHRVEIKAATEVARMAKVEHEIIEVKDILKSRSPLTDPSVELETYESYEKMDKIIGDRVELTFVPMRNAYFLTLAANRAVYADIYDMVTGVCQMDNANYPDCRESFILAQALTINEALDLRGKFKIHTPLMYRSKKETVQLAKHLPGCWEALAYSHTCYAGEIPPCILSKPQACHACTLRQEGFKEAGEVDPLIARFQGQLTSK